MVDADFIEKAIDLACQSVEEGGGPFGALVVKDNKIVASAKNRVALNNDPTAHAEIEAIRAACLNLGRTNLSDCMLFSSCQPCPMCLSAIYWSNVRRVVYATLHSEVAKVGFDDSFIYKELLLNEHERSIEFKKNDAVNSFVPFNKWLSQKKSNKHGT